MAKLPEEILMRVCGHLATPDLGSWRLCSRQFAAIGIEHVWSRPLRVWVTSRGFARFEELIARAPVLASYLRSVEFTNFPTDTGRYLSVRGVLAFQSNAFGHQQIDYNQQPIDGGLGTVEETWTDAAAIGKALYCLPKLEHITLLGDQLCSGRDLPHYLQDQFHGVLWPRGDLERRSQSSSSGQLDRFLKQAGLEYPTGLKSLDIQRLDWRFFKDKSEADLRTLFLPLAGLKRLSIRFTDRMSGLRPCLSGLGDLEDLSIDSDGFKKRTAGDLSGPYVLLPSPYGAGTLDDFFPRHITWPRLRKLKLTSIRSDRLELLSFLERQASTLRELCIRELHLGISSPIQLLDDLRAKLHLDNPCICGAITGYVESPDDHTETLGYTWDADKLHDVVNLYIREGGKHWPASAAHPLAM